MIVFYFFTVLFALLSLFFPKTQILSKKVSLEESTFIFLRHEAELFAAFWFLDSIFRADSSEVIFT